MNSPSEATGGRLPDFLLIGAARCGTTFLFGLIADHPEIYAPFKKELWFFNESGEGLDAYKSYFKEARPGQMAGEATPGYLPNFDPTIANIQRSYDELPQFLVILRDPVDRFWSHYLHNRSHGWETRSFKEVIEEGPDGGTAACLNAPNHETFRVGEYGGQLERWFDAFSRRHFKIVFLEDLAREVSPVLLDIFQFLGVDETVEPIGLDGRRNSFWTPRSEFVRDVVHPYVRRAARRILPERWSWRVHKGIKRLNKSPGEKPKMPLWAREALADYYRSDVARLERLLDRPVPDEWFVSS